jgi:Arc/MetJ family transcription regulator
VLGDSRLECVHLSTGIHIHAAGLKTKREVVEEGLRTLLRLRNQAGIRRLRGKLNWQGDLDAMRIDG